MKGGAPALKLANTQQLEETLELLVVGDEVLEEEKAADFLGISVKTLRQRNVPRAVLNDEEGKRGPIRYLRSQLVLYVLLRTKPRLRLIRVEEVRT